MHAPRIAEPTIGQRLEQLDETRFVGRTSELAQLEALLVDDPTVNVVLLHGPGGIGKSALVRTFVRRARAREWKTLLVEGRDLPPTPDGIENALGELRSSRHALVVFDSWERAAGLTDFLRDHVLTALPAGWIALITGRDEPDVRWTRDGWEQVCRELRLGPLNEADARECVRRHGVADDESARRMLAWAAGSPLALVLGARVGEAWEVSDDAPAEVVDPLVRRLVDAELDEHHLAVLAAAAIARVTTTDLLAAAIPAVDAPAAYEWLAARSFAEALGDGVTLHALVGRAVRAHVELHYRELGRTLRRRIADHTYDQAKRSGVGLSHDLAWLVDDPALRWGFGWDAAGELRIDRLRPGDAESMEAALAPEPDDPWWALTRRYLRESPQHVIVARDRAEVAAGFAVIATSRDRPPLADDPLLGPWLADARQRAQNGEAVLWSRSSDVSGRAGVHALLGLGGVLVSRIANPRYLYLPIDPLVAPAVAFSASIGAQHVPELDVVLGGFATECHVVDFGPGGLLAAQRDVVYRELGIDDDPRSRAVLPDRLDADVVRSLLRDVGRPERMARSYLAVGTTVTERAESVHSLLARAADRTFGTGTHDERLRAVLTCGYLERTTTHEVVAAKLHVSRAVYFRLAREAIDRLTATLQVMHDGG